MDISQLLRTATRETEQVQQIVRLIEMAGWKDEPRILRQVALSQRSGDWEPILKLLRLRFKDAQQFHSYINIPTAAEVAGEVFIADLALPDFKQGPPVFLGLDKLFTHFQIIGPTGAGKTIVSRSIVIQLHLLGIPVWIFDTEDQFKNVVAYCAPGSFWVVDVSKGQFKRNVWQPLLDETFLEVDSRMRDVLRQKWVGEGGTGIESEVAHELHAELGLFTMRQFYERLKRRQARIRDFTQQRYISGLLNRIMDLNTQLAGTYEVLEGYPLEELMRHSIVFRMPNLSADVVFLFVVELLSAVADMRRHERSDYPALAILLDEAQRFFKPTDKSETAMYPLMADHVQTFRKRAVIMVIATQDVFDTPRAISANVGASLFFRTLDGDSNTKIAKSLSLTSEQAHFLNEMPKRHAVMRHPNFLKPFVVRIREVELEHMVSDERIAEMMAPVLASLKWTPSPYAAMPPGETNRKTSVGRSDVNSGDGAPGIEKQTKSEEQALDIELLDYLRAVARDLLVPKATRYEQIKLSAGRGDALSDALLKRGLIEEIKVPTGRRGGQPILLDFTNSGRELLARHGIKINTPKGKGGLVHQFYQNLMARWFAKNFPQGKATIEDMSSGKAVDVSFVGEGKRIAVEILVNGVDKEISNVDADLWSYDEIWLVADNKALDRLKKKVGEIFNHAEMGKIQFHQIGKFFSEMSEEGKVEQ